MRVDDKDKVDVCVSVYGEVDICNERQVSAILEASAAYQMITIDFSEIAFIDASILGVLARFACRRQELDARSLPIVNANTNLRRLFSACELESAFCTEDEPLVGDPLLLRLRGNAATDSRFSHQPKTSVLDFAL
jgi:anti-anti-sigma factor